MPPWCEGVTHEEILADAEMIDLLASLKYLRANYVHMPAEQALYEALSSTLGETRIMTVVEGCRIET